MASAVVSSATLRVQNPLLPDLSHFKSRLLPSRLPKQLRLSPLLPPRSLRLILKSLFPALRVSASSSTSSSATTTTTTSSPYSATSFLADSTRTVSSLAALAFSLSKLFSYSVRSLVERIATAPTAEDLVRIGELRGNLACAVGPLFFAALRDRPSGDLNTPLTVVAAGLARWLDLYGMVLMVRVLLSWFPNIPWQRQPLSAIRDLCDPYLNLFRNIIPPVFNALDVSPLLAFAVLGTLGSILNNSKGGY